MRPPAGGILGGQAAVKAFNHLVADGREVGAIDAEGDALPEVDQPREPRLRRRLTDETREKRAYFRFHRWRERVEQSQMRRQLIALWREMRSAERVEVGRVGPAHF